MGPVDPEQRRPTGGVAIAAFQQRSFQALSTHKHRHPAFENAVRMGRLGKHAIDIGLPQPLIVHNVYPWPCGSSSVTAATRTAALFEAIFREIPARVHTCI